MQALTSANGISKLFTTWLFEPAISQFTIYQRNNHIIFWAVMGVAAVLLVSIVLGGTMMVRHRH